jgi:hypothetical protein
MVLTGTYVARPQPVKQLALYRHYTHPMKEDVK